MNPSQLVLDQVRAMGLKLRDARLARDINPRDLETELRTTYRHLLAIEEGQMRLFYSDSFFCDLFVRYATQLGFSSEQAQAMRLALQGEGPLVEQAEPVSASVAEDQLAVEPVELNPATSEPIAVIEPTTGVEDTRESEPLTPSEPHAPSEPQAPIGTPVQADIPIAEVMPVTTEPEPVESVESVDSVDSVESSKTPMESQPHPEPRAADHSQSLGSLWFWGAIAIGLVFAVVILTLEPSPDAPKAAAVATTPKALATAGQASANSESTQAAGSPASTDKPQDNPKADGDGQNPSGQASPNLSSNAVSALSVAAANSSVANESQQEAPTTPPPEPPRERRISDSILLSALDAPASFSAGAAMTIRFNVKGWVWVREFDDNVREFVVQPGQTVRFSELPIFLVVPFPDQLSARVDNQPVSLRRNDDEKNHARYSRSMLKGLVTNP